jgi:hypothetical protein
MGLFNPLLVERGVCTAVIQANVLNKQRKINPLYTVYIYFIIQACPEGYYGRNCSGVCVYPNYGIKCLGRCNCSEERFKYLCNIQK